MVGFVGPAAGQFLRKEAGKLVGKETYKRVRKVAGSLIGFVFIGPQDGKFGRLYDSHD